MSPSEYAHPEVNFDGLPGPTHGFGGLSFGNVASTSNRAAVSNPRAAALEALGKMRLVHSLTGCQGLLLPHERPDVSLLRRLGFAGSDTQVIDAAWRADPDLVVSACSSSAMWTANAATVCPSEDSADGRVHLTAANLAHQFHRSREADFTARLLRVVFPEAHGFVHHDPLPSHASLGDEGAANHVRLGVPSELGPGSPGGTALQLFVYGDGTPAPTRFPARQTRRASEAIARLNAVRADRLLFARQNPAAIDAGAFHNDVVSVGSADVLVTHARAFAAPLPLPAWVHVLEVDEGELTLEEAVGTYLFNSQLVPVAAGGRATGSGTELAMIAPAEVAEHPRARAAAERLVARGTRLKHLHYVDLRQSMRNGGGPACLRLRVPLTAHELPRVNPGFLLSEPRFAELRAWAERHYRTELRRDDLRDPRLLRESRDALDALTTLLGLPPLYDFQHTPHARPPGFP